MSWKYAARSRRSPRPTRRPITYPYAPDFLRDGERLDLPDDLATLAVRALDRIMAADSEWRDLWQEAAEDVNSAFDAVRDLRKVMAA
ncbi:DUF4259 domain-containing protein [Micromonospora phytophila]|uniref:DUF4259 domain-containing protein n=1 Tax=Micromonospora phytophila TaxID=709888 RepID=UPI00202E3A42|nr:DUF4259 domain-containing protein [Micromonospora phytophila]MCM0674505.1 DUF4259 domain-containing protein [Micromonospora phytophila]